MLAPARLLPLLVLPLLLSPFAAAAETAAVPEPAATSNAGAAGGESVAAPPEAGSPKSGAATGDEESSAPEIPLPPTPPPPPPASSNLVLESLRLEVTGVIFAFWSIDLENGDGSSPHGANRFDLSRTFVDVTPQISDRISARITPDLLRVRGTGGNVDGTMALRLFYAYVRWADVAPGVSVIGGLQSQPLTSFDDSVWKYRVLGPSIFSTFGGLPTSDLGVGVTGKHADGLVEYHLLLSNGEGRDAPELPEGNGKFKEGSARLTFAPFASGNAAWARRLRLTALADYGIQSKFEGDKVQRIRLSGLASLEHSLGTVAVGAGPIWNGLPAESEVVTKHGLLFTTYAFVNLPLNLRVLGRFDFIDPDVEHSAKTSAENQTTGQRTRVIGGIAYRFTDKVQVIADYQRFGYQVEERAKETDPGSTFFIHTEAKF